MIRKQANLKARIKKRNPDHIHELSAFLFDFLYRLEIDKMDNSCLGWRREIRVNRCEYKVVRFRFSKVENEEIMLHFYTVSKRRKGVCFSFNKEDYIEFDKKLTDLVKD